METNRLRMRALRYDDLVDLVTLANNSQVARWLSTMPHPYSDADGREWIARVQQDHATGRPPFAIALKETDRLIGGVGLDGSTGDGSEEPALGYRLGQPYWGNGYAREAVAVVIDYGLRTLGINGAAASKRSAKSNLRSRPVLVHGMHFSSACRSRRPHDKRDNVASRAPGLCAKQAVPKGHAVNLTKELGWPKFQRQELRRCLHDPK